MKKNITEKRNSLGLPDTNEKFQIVKFRNRNYSDLSYEKGFRELKNEETEKRPYRLAMAEKAAKFISAQTIDIFASGSRKKENNPKINTRLELIKSYMK